MPLRLVGLQCVVTADATLFARHRGIGGAERPLAIDIDELRYWIWVWRRGERLDGAGHPGIGRRRQDLASGAADGGQAKIGVVAILLVESLDRMGAERRRNRGIFSELRSDCRIVGDKGVDQPERDDLFAPLVLLEPVHAEIIKPTADRQGERQEQVSSGQ